MEHRPNPGYSFTVRVNYVNDPGQLGALTTAIGAIGGDISGIDIVESTPRTITRDLTINAYNADHSREILAAIQGLGITVSNVSDRVFLLHLGGKLHIEPKINVRTRDDFTMAYTPGVSRVAQAILEDPGKAFTLTVKKNAVAVVTDGSAVLSLGDVGPAAALPVMEGKCMLFRDFGGVNAWPVCLDVPDANALVAAVKAIAPVYGGIHLEDIAAPKCFEVEEILAEELDIPVFLGDRDGTSIVVAAAFINALKVVGKRRTETRVVVFGTGPSGVGTVRMLRSMGVTDILVCDETGIITPARPDLDAVKARLAENTNRAERSGSLRDALQDADVLVAVHRSNSVSREDIEGMAKDAIVFTLATPEPDINPEQTVGVARIIATRRTDYPNQINNVLCYPGLFRGLLDVRARRVTDGMKLAAARAIADCVRPEALHEDYVIPSLFDPTVPAAVAAAVQKAAAADGVARK
jgi:malate dehydrogenase (oxaloacetate-decarboxylating)